MPGPPFIGLTGGIGAGKSAALDAFGRLGAATIATDAVVHELLATDELRDLVAERWGEEVVSSGAIDREAVGRIVFADADELRWLESALHPRVGARLHEWRAGLPAGLPAAIVEVPLLYETGLEALFDAVVVVTAEDAIRSKRAGERGTTDFAGREERQMPQAEKEERADHVIRNDGSLEDLERGVAEVIAAVSS